MATKISESKVLWWVRITEIIYHRVHWAWCKTEETGHKTRIRPLTRRICISDTFHKILRMSKIPMKMKCQTGLIIIVSNKGRERIQETAVPCLQIFRGRLKIRRTASKRKLGSMRSKIWITLRWISTGRAASPSPSVLAESRGTWTSTAWVTMKRTKTGPPTPVRKRTWTPIEGSKWKPAWTSGLLGSTVTPREI